MNAGLSTKNAPSPSVVLPHYAVGSVAFLIASVLMFFASQDIVTHYVSPKVLSVAHILILGWITVIIFGALYQLIPVVMEIKLYSEILAHISFYSITLGTVMITYSFWFNHIADSLAIEIGGTLVFLSVILFAYNAVRSAMKSDRKTIENAFIVTSIFWLFLTVSLGTFIVLNQAKGIIDKSSIDLMKIHIHFGLAGWFMMLVMGVASTLLPMFFIAHKLNRKLLKASYYLTNSGLILLSFALYFFPNTYILLAIAGIIISGMLLFILYNYEAYKKRLRKKLDIGMKLTVFAFPLFFLTLIFGFATLIVPESISTKFGIAYVASLILGFLTSLILGQMYKTLPFIIWLVKYQDKVGKFKVPMPSKLYSEKVADWHYYSFAVAIITLLAGIFLGLQILAQISAVAFVITSGLFAFNTFKIIFHKEDVKPL